MNTENQPKSRTEWFELVKEQIVTGLTHTEFCKQRNLILCRFSYYKKLYTEKPTNVAKASFSSVVLNESPQSKSNDIKIELPNGVRCHVPGMIAVEKLKQLIGALLSC